MMRAVLTGCLATALATLSYGLTYDVTVIRSSDTDWLDAIGMNNNGEVIGTAVMPDMAREYFVYRDGKVEYLHVPGVAIQNLKAINDHCTIVGEYSLDNNVPRAFMIKNGHYADIGTNRDYTTVQDVNEKDQATGYYVTDSGHIHAYIAEDGAIYDIGTLGGTLSEGRAINDFGNVVGFSTSSLIGDYQAFYYHNGTMANLSPAGTTISFGTCINNSGLVVVAGHRGDYSHSVYLYSQNTMVRLRDGFSAYALNNSGSIIGTLIDADGNEDCVLYENGNYIGIASLIASPPSGWHLGKPVTINDNGQILCYGNSPNSDYYQLWLLTPHAVPEPASIFALAAPSLMLMVRRRKQT